MTYLTRVFILLRDGSFRGVPALVLPDTHVEHVEEYDHYDEVANGLHEDFCLVLGR